MAKKSLTAFRSIIPVNSFIREEVAREEESHTPEVGLCWGKESAFTHSPQGQYNSGRRSTSVELPKEKIPVYSRIIDVGSQFTWSFAYVRKPGAEDDDASWVKVKRINDMVLEFTELRPKKHVGSMQPYLHSHYYLRFALHPVEEKEVVK